MPKNTNNVRVLIAGNVPEDMVPDHAEKVRNVKCLEKNTTHVVYGAILEVKDGKLVFAKKMKGLIKAFRMTNSINVKNVDLKEANLPKKILDLLPCRSDNTPAVYKVVNANLVRIKDGTYKSAFAFYLGAGTTLVFVHPAGIQPTLEVGWWDIMGLKESEEEPEEESEEEPEEEPKKKPAAREARREKRRVPTDGPTTSAMSMDTWRSHDNDNNGSDSEVEEVSLRLTPTKAAKEKKPITTNSPAVRRVVKASA